jgi:uncharacterized membrane protein
MRDTQRLEAFTDGVVAIIITVMVLELRPPHGYGLSDLRELVPELLSYVLSFVYVAIYWNNHHNLMIPAERVTGGVLWANLNLLFWLSLVPFTTAWMGREFKPAPSALYGGVLLATSIAYQILERQLAREHPNSVIAELVRRGVKEKISSLLYILGVLLSWIKPWIGASLYVAAAAMWFVPDRRMERATRRRHHAAHTKH